MEGDHWDDLDDEPIYCCVCGEHVVNFEGQTCEYCK